MGMLGMSTFGELRGVMTLDYQRYITGLQKAGDATSKAQDRINAIKARGLQANAMLGAASVLGFVRPAMRVMSQMNDFTRDYMKTIAKIGSVTDNLTSKDLATLDRAFIQIGKSAGVLPTLVAESGYIAAQAMYDTVDQIKSLAKESADMNIASGFEIAPKDSAEMYTRFLRMLQLPIDQLGFLSDTFLETRNVGVMTMDDIAKHAGRAASVFVAAFPKNKIGAFQDMMTLAASSSYTLAPDQVFTGLRGIMDRVYRESREKKSALNAIAKQLNYMDAVDMLEKSGNMSNFLGKIKQMGGAGLRYITGLGYERREQSVIASLLQGSARTDLISSRIYGASGAKTRAMEQMKNTPEYKYQRYEAAKEAFKLSFGRITVVYATMLMEKLTKIFDYFEKLPESTKNWIVLGTIFATMAVTLNAIVQTLRFFTATNTLSTLISGFGGISKAGVAGKAQTALGWGRSAGNWANSNLTMPTFKGALADYFGNKGGVGTMTVPKSNLPWGASTGMRGSFDIASSYMWQNRKLMNDKYFKKMLNDFPGKHSLSSGVSPSLLMSFYKDAKYNSDIKAGRGAFFGNPNSYQNSLNFGTYNRANEWMRAKQPVNTGDVFTRNIGKQMGNYRVPGAALGQGVATATGAVAASITNAATMIGNAAMFLKNKFMACSSSVSSFMSRMPVLNGIFNISKTIGGSIASIFLVGKMMQGWWVVVKPTFDGLGTALGMLATGIYNLLPNLPTPGKYDNWSQAGQGVAVGSAILMENAKITARSYNEMFIDAATFMFSAIKGDLKTWDKERQARAQDFYQDRKKGQKNISSMWDGFFNYPTAESTGRGEREAAQRAQAKIDAQNQINDNETALQIKPVMKILNEYANAMVHGSVEAWNARAPTYQNEDKAQTEIMRQQLKEQRITNRKLAESAITSLPTTATLSEGSL